MSRNEKGLREAIKEIQDLREDFYKNVNVPGSSDEYNEELAKAGRVSDFLELGELFAKDGLERTESCGGHFRKSLKILREKLFVMIKTLPMFLLGNIMVSHLKLS